MTPTSKSEDPPQGPLNDLESSAVGYGSPPKHSQFKKGKSGNPKGRPPTKCLHLVLEDILNEKITLAMNGEKVEMTRKEAIILQLTNASMKGNNGATKNLIYLLKNLYWINPI